MAETTRYTEFDESQPPPDGWYNCSDGFGGMRTLLYNRDPLYLQKKAAATSLPGPPTPTGWIDHRGEAVAGVRSYKPVEHYSIVQLLRVLTKSLGWYFRCDRGERYELIHPLVITDITGVRYRITVEVLKDGE